MVKLETVVLLGLAVDGGRVAHRNKNRHIQLAQKRLEGFLRGVGSAKANCGEFNSLQYETLKPYLIDERGSKSYYSGVADAGNKIPQNVIDRISEKGDNEKLTYGNGWCDKNVYRSWNKCAVSGKCYVGCTDGNCYDEVASEAAQIRVPEGCNRWMLKCAQECTDDAKCAAWSFKNTNVLGNAEYTCNLMSEVLCSRSEQNYGDPRTVYHVKNSAVQALFNDHGVDTIAGLESTMFKTGIAHRFNYWSSWGYHLCLSDRPDGQKCETGFQKRQRMSPQGKMDIEKRDCLFATADGTVVECEEVEEEEEEVNSGHGWMDWAAWTPCSQSCGSNGVKKRSRRCGTCSNPDNQGLCTNPTTPVHKRTAETDQHCPHSGESELATCVQAKCLPWANGLRGNQKYVIRNGWATHQNGQIKNSDADYLGGCVDYELESVKVKVQINSVKNAFAECMRQCADLGADCLSVTYFPRLQAPHWINFWSGDDHNCFLHKRRCHEDQVYRDQDFLDQLPGLGEVEVAQYQSVSPSWYAYKDLCSNTMICDRWGAAANPFYAALCDSTGPNAFPAQPACSCPWTKDSKSAVRAWGNAVGWNYYDEDQKRILNRRRNKQVQQRAPFYTEKKYYNGVPDFLNSVPNGILPCHDPCTHHQCTTNAKCVFNPLSSLGYDCVCTWPSVVKSEFASNPGVAGLVTNQGCVSPDFRNPSSSPDNAIMFGGGWNTLRDPGQSRPVKPHTAYYQLTATSDPWTFNVAEVTRIPPTSPNSPKGRFYNCIVNLDHNRMMVVAGKSGQFFDTFDDKTMVYQWNQDKVDNGTWVGVRGEDQTGPCLGDRDENNVQHGCIRDGEWPDYPHTPIGECQGQCRAGQVGKGPTSVHWLNQYCTVKGEFFNGNNWVEKQFQLCENKIVRNDRTGEKIDGLDGKWIAVPNNQLEQEKAAYNRAVVQTIPYYGADSLESLDAENHPLNRNTKEVNGKRVLNYWRWKSGKTLPTSMYSPFLGLVSAYQRPESGKLKLLTGGRTYHGMGQPLCGLVGDRVLTGSGAIGRIMSLSKTPETVERERVWKTEPKSEFPLLRRRSDGSECRTREQFEEIQGVKTAIKFRPLDARRQNFGTVVTTEGLWMIGGLLEPAADLPYRARSDMMNIEGCTKRAHLEDVWVFNPKGWTRDQILGDAAEKYKQLEDAQILPTIFGYPFSTEKVEVTNLTQSFENFRLYDQASDGITIDQAIEEGWECTGIDGNWCRKPFLNRHTKGAESQVMCFEYQEGEEFRSESSPSASDSETVPRRPRHCSIDETANDDNDCICYIIQASFTWIKASGQSGPKQTTDGAGFRPEIDYLEIRRADGTFGSDRKLYKNRVTEHCPDAETTYPTVDPPIVHDKESAVADATQCSSKCGGVGQPDCNRTWQKKNLRRRWHEAGRIKHGRMGSLSGVLKGELLLWGGECYGDSTVRDFGPDGQMRSASNVKKPRPCRMITEKSGNLKMGDYIEAFSFIRMNRAGFLFGERRAVDLVGFPVGSASHDESATSQAYSAMNTFHL